MNKKEINTYFSEWKELINDLQSEVDIYRALIITSLSNDSKIYDITLINKKKDSLESIEMLLNDIRWQIDFITNRLNEEY